MSSPTLFRTEAISKLSEIVENVKSIATEALELVQSSRVKYDLSQNSGGWIGSVSFVQEKIGVLVILSIGHTSNDLLEMTQLNAALNDLALPIELNTSLEVYKIIESGHARYHLGDLKDITLCLYRNENGLRLRLTNESMYNSTGFCIYGLIPDATLNIETEEINN